LLYKELHLQYLHQDHPPPQGLWRDKEVKEAWTILSFCAGFGILGSLSRLLLQDLLRQAFPWIPFNLSPTKYSTYEETQQKRKQNISAEQQR
jgi:hypothetical protein